MSRSPRALVMSPQGSDRLSNVVFALERAGATSRGVSFRELMSAPDQLLDAHLVVVAAGFPVADEEWAIRVRSLELMRAVGDPLRAMVAAGKPVLGIGGGFQLLTHAGLLPGALTRHVDNSGHAGWVQLEVPATRCVWTQGLGLIDAPISHTMGRYVHPDPESLADHGQVALRYRGQHPTGSVANIAGVCDRTGVVLGLAPSPELHVLPRQHPQHRMPHHTEGSHLGLMIFERGVKYATRLLA